jgi:SAM-dependent methyltransferase
MINLHAYRESESEQLRIGSLMSLTPERGEKALDLGARDGYLSLRLAERFDQVCAVDLVEPKVQHQRVQCVAADGRALPFPDSHFDFVLCAEVLEHIPKPGLSMVCAELVRVAQSGILIGVPYRQDLRIGQSTCKHCGVVNPLWGHVNSFDVPDVVNLFPNTNLAKVEYVGRTKELTSAVSVALMNYAGNPYGVYGQEEPCVSCGKMLVKLGDRSFSQKVATRVAVLFNEIQQVGRKPKANWVHLLFRKRDVQDSCH